MQKRIIALAYIALFSGIFGSTAAQAMQQAQSCLEGEQLKRNLNAAASRLDGYIALLGY